MKLSPEARCKANFETWFAIKGGPQPKFLTEARRLEIGIQSPVIAPDRAMFEATPEILACLRANSRGKWELGAHKHQPCGCLTDIDGGREYRQIRYALQWILHEYRGHWFIEADFDGFNPGEGAGPAALHLFAEVIPNAILHTKTSPFKVAKYRGWA